MVLVLALSFCYFDVDHLAQTYIHTPFPINLFVICKSLSMFHSHTHTFAHKTHSLFPPLFCGLYGASVRSVFGSWYEFSSLLGDRDTIWYFNLLSLSWRWCSFKLLLLLLFLLWQLKQSLNCRPWKMCFFVLFCFSARIRNIVFETVEFLSIAAAQ